MNKLDLLFFFMLATFLGIDIIRREVLGPARVVLSPLAVIPAIESPARPVWPERAQVED